MPPKKIHANSIIGEQGINLIQRIVLDIGFMWYPTGGTEAGIDGTIELRDPTTGEVFNTIIGVQSKATSGAFIAETTASFEYLCHARDLDYWLRGNVPVVLVVSRPRTNEAYWVSVKDYFKDSAARQSRKVFFDKQQHRFDETCGPALMKIAVPKDAGLYLAPPPVQEKLYTNLLCVSSFAERIYIADSLYQTGEELWSKLREASEEVGEALILKRKQLISFYDLSQPPWSSVCDISTLKSFDSSDWAYTDDRDRCDEFVQLLSRALAEKVQTGLAYSKRKDCFYFRPTEDLGTRRYRYRSQKIKTGRDVFERYTSRKSGRLAYYRHSAFRSFFKRIDGIWYLEITPTYYFSWDGRRISRYHEDAIKGIKRLERNPAVLGQLLMWAEYLNAPADMFTRPYPFLSFGDLLSFDLDAGINDAIWLKQEEKSEVDIIGSNENQLQLFDE